MKKLYVVGLGPGDAAQLTGRAAAALEECELLCGYTGYISLIRDRYPHKELLDTPMTREAERCRAALAEAAKGRPVAMVCGGDPGVYGMASPILELAGEYPGVEVEVVPGVTAALGGGALLGAPLSHDFAVVSLSDRLTPWERIEGRLRGAARADFVLCLYNLDSRLREGYLGRACRILLEELPPHRPCGWARAVGRPGEAFGSCTLAQLAGRSLDMSSTAFIGNSATRLVNGRLVTPRGYGERL